MTGEQRDDTLDDWDGVFRSGVVDEVNDPGDQAVDGYPVTRDELLVLLRYWVQLALDVDLFWFFYATSDKSGRAWRGYANERIAQIEALLGEGAVQAGYAEVWSQERARIGEEYWRIFTQGSTAERDGVSAETHQGLDYLDANCQAAFAFLRDHPAEVFLDAAGDLWYLVDPPRDWEAPPPQLRMQVRTRKGASRIVWDYEIARPPGWIPPFGLQ